jgi:hypothetical protein
MGNQKQPYSDILVCVSYDLSLGCAALLSSSFSCLSLPRQPAAARLACQTLLLAQLLTPQTRDVSWCYTYARWWFILSGQVTVWRLFG